MILCSSGKPKLVFVEGHNDMSHYQPSAWVVSGGLQYWLTDEQYIKFFQFTDPELRSWAKSFYCHPRLGHHPRAHPLHRLRPGVGLRARRVEGRLLHRRAGSCRWPSWWPPPWPPPRTTRRSRAPLRRRPAWPSRSSSGRCCWSSPSGVAA